MCTYDTVSIDLDGSGKGPGGVWQPLTRATVYFDHPVHLPADHSLNIDLWDQPPGQGGNRVALELTASSARQLCAAIQEALAAVPEQLVR